MQYYYTLLWFSVSSFRYLLYELYSFITQSMVNRGEWLWNPTKFFVVGFCLLWGLDCAKTHNSHLLRTEELTNRNMLVTKLMHSVWAQNKRFCTVVDLSTLILAFLFAPLMFARLPNHPSLLTMLKANPVDSSVVQTVFLSFHILIIHAVHFLWFSDCFYPSMFKWQHPLL